MFGTILKFAAVATVGAIGFATTGFYMDADVVDKATKACEDHSLANEGRPAEERAAIMNAFVTTNRAGWVDQLTFAGSVKELDSVLAKWL